MFGIGVLLWCEELLAMLTRYCTDAMSLPYLSRVELPLLCFSMRLGTELLEACWRLLGVEADTALVGDFFRGSKRSVPLGLVSRTNKFVDASAGSEGGISLIFGI